MHFLLALANLLSFPYIQSISARPVGGRAENDPFLETPKFGVIIPPLDTIDAAQLLNGGWVSPIYPYVFARRLPLPKVLVPLTSYTNETTGEAFDFYQIVISHVSKVIYPDREPTKLEGYNAEIPGPHFKTTVGRRSVVRFINQVDQAASIHLHGSPTRPSFDGWAEDVMMPGEFKDYIYPNENARTLWYHDHAIGTTARNVRKGQAGIYWIENPYLEEKFQLPRGNYDIPLTLTDEIYEKSGQIWDNVGAKPKSDETREVDENSSTDIKEHSFYGDIIHVNGMPWPYLDVEPRKYRLRILDASVSRSYNLTFQTSKGVKLPFHIIGTDSGFMETPQQVNNIIVAMAERYETVVDFSVYGGQNITLVNARSFGNNNDYAMTHFVMQFVVGTEITSKAGNGQIPNQLVRMEYPINPGKIDRSFVFGRTNHRWTINEVGFMDAAHRVQATPRAGSVEVWELVNEGGDWAHPVHIHLIDFQVISRTGLKDRGVEPWERGYKDVVFVDQMERVKVIARYHPWPGQYMFHCHNLVHEDNDMMAVFDVNNTGSNRKYGDDFSDPMAPQWRAKTWPGITDLDEIKKVLLPRYSAMDIYPRRIVEESSAPLGGGVITMEDLAQQYKDSSLLQDYPVRTQGNLGDGIPSSGVLIPDQQAPAKGK